MRICFIGPAAPDDVETGSFLVALLGELGAVSTVAVSRSDVPAGNDGTMRELATSRFDRYVFWQTEDVAERLLPLNLGASVLVPSPIAAAARPDDFWRQFVRHRIIALSRPLHERLQRLSCSTSYFQYFPEPGPRRERPIDVGALDAMFEERAAGSAAELAFAVGQCRALGVKTLHVRASAAPAPGRQLHERIDADGQSRLIDGIEVRVSRHEEDAGADPDRAASPLFFFGPRPASAIGATTLAAMGRGQIVVAPDQPSANEHVAHLVSGLLYRPEAATPARFARLGGDALVRMSDAARRTAVAGRRDWLQDAVRLTSIVADDGQRWGTLDRSSHFGRVMQAAAHRRAAGQG